MEELTTSSGLTSLGAVVIALSALVLAAVSAGRLRRIRHAQRVVMGERSARDIVDHTVELDARCDEILRQIEALTAQLDRHGAETAGRLDHAIAHTAVIRYDAYGEMSGQQSSSVALLDASATGLVLSSILHRDQARLYAKQLLHGNAEIELSPEEQEAVASALDSGAGTEGTTPTEARTTR